MITLAVIKQHWSRILPLHRWIALGGVVVIVVGIGGYRLLIPQPKVIFPTGPSLGTTQVSNTQPIRIVFNHPVKRSALTYEIHPTLKGTWDLSTSYLTAESTLTFTPAESPDLDTRYTIALAGIQSLLGGNPKKYLLSFQTDTMPVLTTVSPASRAVEVLPDAPLVVNFDKPITDSVSVTVAITPEIPFETATISDQTITFPHEAPFQKSTEYTYQVFISTVKRDYATGTMTVSEEKKEIGSVVFTTIAAPGIEASSPSGTGVDPASPIRITFKQPMEHLSTEAAFSVAPTIAGTFSWEGDTVMMFTPATPLAKATEYTVTLAPTAKATTGVTADEPYTFTFTTIGAVTVSSFAPANGATGADINTNINISFNQAVDHPSAESKFSVFPSVDGAFSWDGNTMIFNPNSSLAHNSSYTATVAAGVKTVIGLDSTAAFSSKFTTRSQSVMLNVPAYRQAHNYSCMIAAARSAMAFRGVYVSESAIISRVGRDTTAWSGTWGGDDGVWGDPEADIVGPLDNAAATSPAGKQTTNVYWGYGSHWGPISAAMASYGVANDVHRNMTVQQLAQSLTENNPVVIWWVNGIWPSYEVRWRTPAGKQITGVNGLHVQVVRGFAGTVENPTSFTLTDSGYGYPGRTFDVGTFKAKWAWFGNTGIIVK